MKNKIFLLITVVSLFFLSGCELLATIEAIRITIILYILIAFVAILIIALIWQLIKKLFK